MSTFTSSTLNDAEDQNSSVSKFHPVDIDGNRILWGGNPAYLDGALYECQLFYERTGHFKALLEDGASLLGNGKLAVDSVHAIDFASGMLKDPETFNFLNPCPPTVTRIAKFDAAATAGSTPKFTSAPDRVPDAVAKNFTVSKHYVNQDDRQLHDSLGAIVVDRDLLAGWVAETQNNGRLLIVKMQEFAATADHRDKALVTAELANFIAAGHPGEITLK